MVFWLNHALVLSALEGVTWLPSNPNPEVAERRQRIVQSTGKLRDELLAGEIFYALAEAQVLIER